MSIVIKIENLSKKYVIGHQRQEKYTALRDVIMHKLRGLGERLLHPMSPNKEETSLENFWALKDINLEIKQGDRVGIIGRNGAGKSTLLKILSRITEPTTGRITINGRVASLLEVGTGFHPELTGRENIFLNGAILGMSRADIKKNFDEIVAFAEVEKFLDTPVKRYSSGMYVRLAFAVAAHLEPEILVIDEVLAVGDAQFQKKCLGKMEEVGKEGRTVLFVSHNMNAIQTLCTKAIRLENGSLIGQGEVAYQIENYLKDIQKKNTVGPGSFVQCGDGVQLTRLEFSPNPVTSKNKVGYVVELIANHPITISALVILIYSALGERIAILDLRGKDGAVSLDFSSHLIIEGSIKSLPLVDGNYNIGLYIDYGLFSNNIYRLVDLTVISPVADTVLVPFRPEVRGVIELDYTVREKSFELT
jgi:lipopolysaccharide transport system ATP-binding protein